MSKRKGDPGYAAGWCIHYRSSMDHKTCEAGVAYDLFPKPSKWPCFLRTHPNEYRSDVPSATCDKLHPPTKEEVALHENWISGRIEKLGKAMAAISPFRKTHRGQAHSIPCPVCESGTLSFSIAASNGHCHARCSTDGCVSWME